MNKKILIIVIVIFSSLLITIGSVFLYQKYKVAHAVKIVNIKMHEVEVYSDVMLSDLITSMNGHLIKDKKINTDMLGSYEVAFDYINDDELVEVTPVSYRLRKKILNTNERKKFDNKKKA